MKKIIVTLLCLFIALSLIGCDSAIKGSSSGDGGGKIDSQSVSASDGQSGSVSESPSGSQEGGASDSQEDSASDSQEGSGEAGEERDYVVTLLLNGGSIADNRVTVTVAYGEEYDLGVPEKDENDFIGWFHGEEEIETSGVWQYREDMTLTARWQSNWSPIV